VVEVLNINTTDLKGESFNNFQAAPEFQSIGIQHRFLVKNKESSSDLVYEAYSSELLSNTSLKISAYLSRSTGYQNRLNFWNSYYKRISKLPKYDLLHFHLIENGWFYLPAALKLMQQQPSIWTWHDLWPITGHCIQPLGCVSWKLGCKSCPDLNRPFKVNVDRTGQQFKFKVESILDSKVEIHVTTQWSKNRILEIEPRFAEKLNVIPFGISIPKAVVTPGETRESLLIDKDDIVVFVRGTSGNYKNVSILVRTLLAHPELARRIVLIDVDSGNFFDDVPLKRYVKFSWLPRSKMLDLLRASNVVIVPSSGETFGVLVVEAQLCKIPVIVQAGTACDAVAGGTRSAFNFNGFNAVSELRELLSSLIDQETIFTLVGENGFHNASDRFSVSRYVRDMGAFYNGLLPKFHNRKS